MEWNLKFIYFGYAIFFILVGPVIPVSPTKGNDKSCSEMSMGECLEKLQTFLKLKTLPFTCDEPELNKLCNTTVAGYNCSSTKISIPNCLSPADKEMFNTFLGMAQYTMNMFCESGGKPSDIFIREDLLKNSECIMKQKEALDCCAEGSKLTDLPVMYILEESSKSMTERQIEACCPMSNFLKCAVPIVEKNCGRDAGNLTMSYYRRASGEPLEAMCQKIPGYPEPNSEICEASPPVCSASRLGVLLGQILSAMFLLFIAKISNV